MRTIDAIEIEKETIQDVTLSRILSAILTEWLAGRCKISLCWRKSFFLETRKVDDRQKLHITRNASDNSANTAAGTVLHSSGIASISLGNY